MTTKALPASKMKALNARESPLPYRHVNVGGGPRFDFPGWLNLDNHTTEGSFQFSPTCHFPLENKTVGLVYTSHTLEHLDDATVARVLDESHRILNETGELLVKIPHFDLALKAWRNKDASFFRDDLWNYNSVTPSWASRGVPDNIDSRATMLFCGFWTDDLGDAFSPEAKVFTRKSYHGPAIATAEGANRLLRECSPHSIASQLATTVRQTEKNFSFNHQNAWSETELSTLLARHRFRVLSCDPELIIRRFEKVPGIEEMRTISLYCWAIKEGGRHRGKPNEGNSFREQKSMENASMELMKLRAYAYSADRKEDEFPLLYANWEKLILEMMSAPSSPIKSVKKSWWKKALGIGKARSKPDSIPTVNPKTMTMGRINSETASKLKAKLLAAKTRPFAVEDHAPGYNYGRVEAYVKGLNEDHIFLDLNEELSTEIRQALVEMTPVMNEFFGYPIKVVNVRGWLTPQSVKQRGPNEWHRDGFPSGLLKTLLYLTPPGEVTGTTEIRLPDGREILAEGDAGAFCCFDSNALMHRGVAPRPEALEGRLVIEVTSMPFFFNVTEPVFPGNNANWPLTPLHGLPYWGG